MNVEISSLIRAIIIVRNRPIIRCACTVCIVHVNAVFTVPIPNGMRKHYPLFNNSIRLIDWLPSCSSNLHCVNEGTSQLRRKAVIELEKGQTKEPGTVETLFTIGQRENATKRRLHFFLKLCRIIICDCKYVCKRIITELP